MRMSGAGVRFHKLVLEARRSNVHRKSPRAYEMRYGASAEASFGW